LIVRFTDEQSGDNLVVLDEEIEQFNPKKRKEGAEAWQKRDSEGEFLTLYEEPSADGTKLYQ